MSRLDGNLFVLSALIVLLLAVGGLASGGNYLSVYNLQSMANQVPEIGLLAIGVMLAMCSGNGGIDLSGIALANLSGVASGLFALSLFPVDEAPRTRSAPRGCAPDHAGASAFEDTTSKKVRCSRCWVLEVYCSMRRAIFFRDQ